jgi:hypothetical protein
MHKTLRIQLYCYRIARWREPCMILQNLGFYLESFPGPIERTSPRTSLCCLSEETGAVDGEYDSVKLVLSVCPLGYLYTPK